MNGALITRMPVRTGTINDPRPFRDTAVAVSRIIYLFGDCANSTIAVNSGSRALDKIRQAPRDARKPIIRLSRLIFMYLHTHA